MDELTKWLKSMEYLPEHMRDFHDQKAIFKEMHSLYDASQDSNGFTPPSWVDGHIYTVDWFLWFMAKRGYTLQKSRKKLDFIANNIEATKNE